MRCLSLFYAYRIRSGMLGQIIVYTRLNFVALDVHYAEAN